MKPTGSMIRAVSRVRMEERENARIFAEKVFLSALKSPVIEDAGSEEEKREWAGNYAAAEVTYKFS